MDRQIKVLFLDDMEVRHKLFRTWYDGADHCYTYDECVKLFKLNRYDIASLDHDLSEKDIMCLPGTSSGLTGTDVAKAVAQLVQKPRIVVLHTLNPAGAKSMAGILNDAGVNTIQAPFGFDPTLYKQLAEIAGK